MADHDLHDGKSLPCPRSILIVGVDSQIGLAAKDFLTKRGFSIFGTTRKRQNVDARTYYLDLENPDLEVFDRTFDAAVICAATTNNSECESDPQKHRKINVEGTIKLMDRLAADGSFIVYLSSNLVFDGVRPFAKHTDKTSPGGLYGKFKSEVEDHVEENLPGRACVLRLTKVITKKTDFIEQWRKTAAEGSRIRTWSDVFLSPVDIEDVADAIALLITQERSGLYQLGGDEEVSYSDYARALFKDSPEALGLISEERKTAQGGKGVHNSLKTHLPTREAQYNELLEAERVTMGLMSGHAYLGDTKRLAFTLSRYKFVSKMLSGLDSVLEVGCADAFGAPIVLNEVKRLVACDFDSMFISDAKINHPFRDRIDFRSHDMVRAPMKDTFDGVFSLDVLEHIDKHCEDDFMRNVCQCLTDEGVCVIGMPSLESQTYASEISKQGHVNCKKGPELKSFLAKYFERVFIFSMNDEVVHTGYQPMSQYLLALCCHPLRRPK